jgi:intein/homing endonuclease
LRHGLYTDKSLTIEFPKLRKDLVRHFIRGFFDGDGCLDSYIDKNKVKNKERFRAKFTCASPLFLTELAKILLKNGIRTHYTKNHEGNKSVNLCIGGFGSLRRFLEYIYEDSSVFLERKNEFYKTHKYLLDTVKDREE